MLILKVYDDMAVFGVTPITQHLVTFLGACLETSLSAREVHLVVSRALAFCAAQKGDCAVYAALLKFCIGQGIPEKAADVWRTIKKVRVIDDRSPVEKDCNFLHPS